jgi:hypothetical protein
VSAQIYKSFKECAPIDQFGFAGFLVKVRLAHLFSGYFATNR